MTTLAESAAQRPIVLDGGLGTLLEARGNDISSELWSAQLLLDDPDEIRAAHREFFAAGAEVAITSSYQMSHTGLARVGYSADDTDRLLLRSVGLAGGALQDSGGNGWIAASVGPYGASLADGSEYRGDYGLTVDELRKWHHRRVQVLASSGADLLAIETIPSLAEVEAVLAEVSGTGTQAWLSVTIANGKLRSGESLEQAFAMADDVDEIVAIGVNCSNPKEIDGAIAAARQVSAKAVVVYPNSGEVWDAASRTWSGTAGLPTELIAGWVEAGANLIGGCCRIGTSQLATIAEVVRRNTVP